VTFAAADSREDFIIMGEMPIPATEPTTTSITMGTMAFPVTEEGYP